MMFFFNFADLQRSEFPHSQDKRAGISNFFCRSLPCFYTYPSICTRFGFFGAFRYARKSQKGKTR